MLRTRWAAVGAAVAITLGAGGIGVTHATSPAAAAAFVPITPCRLVDTRTAPNTVGPRTSPLGPAERFTVTGRGAQGNCTASQLPATATALQLNVTAIGATAATFLTIFPSGAERPKTSNLNPTPGAPPTPNAVTTKLSAAGTFDVYNGFGSVDVVIDVVGYYTGHNHDDRYYTEAEVDALLPDVYAAGGAGFTNFPAANTALDLVTVSLPAGSFLLNANVVANNNDASSATVGCSLLLGGVVVAGTTDALFILAASGFAGERESIAVNGAGTLAAPATARLSCRSSATLGNYLAPSIVVTTVHSVTTN